MKAKVVKGSLAAVALILALLAGMPLAALAQGNATVLTVGYLGASAGARAALDRNLYQAAVLAAEQINTSDDYGVISDANVRYRFEVVFYPADSAEEAVEAYTDALIDGAVAVIGPQQPRYLEAILDAVGTPDIPLLVTDMGDLADETNVFRLASDEEAWVQAAADYLVEERHFSNIAVVAVDTEAAQNGADLFAGFAGEDNLALSITHAADADDLSGEAQDIADADADALFVWMLDAQGALLLDALDEAGWRGPIIYVGLDETLADSDLALADELIGLTPWSPAAYDADSQQFVEDYAARWDGDLPADSAAACYDAVYLLAEAVRTAGDDVSEIADALADTDYLGVQGAYSGGATDALRLVAVRPDGGYADLAYYTGGVCLSCSDLNLPPLDEEDADSAQPFNIALITTLSGVNADAGDDAQQGAELAIREIDLLGGVMGADGAAYNLRLGVYNATTVSGAATAFNDALEDGARIILGPDSNAQVTDNANLPAQAGVLQLVTATGLPSDLFTGDENILQLRAGDGAQAQAAVNYLVDERGFTRVAAVTVRANYGNEAEQAIWDAFDEIDDADLVLDLQHNAGDSDYARMATRVIDSEAEAVLVWSAQPVLVGLLDELGAAGWSGVVIYGYPTPSLAATVTVPAGIELLGAASWWPVVGDGTSAGFVARYQARYGELPTAQSAAYYDAVYLVAQALRAVGPETEDIKAWLLEQSSFVGVQGVYDPADNGGAELSRSVVIVGLSDGQTQAVVEAARYLDGVCASGCAADSVVWRFEGEGQTVASASGVQPLSSWLPDPLRGQTVILDMGYNVNLRTAPTLDSDVIDVVPYAAEVAAFAISPDLNWVVVYYRGHFGWVLLDYAAVSSGSLNMLAVSDYVFSS